MKAANSNVSISLRPYLPADAELLAALFRASVMELTEEDYDEDQREAWAGAADDEEAFAARLAAHLTLVALIEGEITGFITLKDDRTIDLLYVAPEAAGIGVATTLCNAAETLAGARGAETLSVDASDTALGFFQQRGYAPQSRNSVPRGDVWLANTSMKKSLASPKVPS